MKKILIIARHEFLTVVTRRAYILSLIMLPLLVGAVFVWLKYKTAGEEAAERLGKIGVIDNAGIVDFSMARSLLGQKGQSSDERLQLGDLTLDRYEDLDAALNGLRNSELDILYVIRADHLQTGGIDLYSRESQHLQGNSPTGFSVLNKLLRASLVQRIRPPDSLQGTRTTEIVDRLVTPPRLDKLTVNADGGVSPLTSTWTRISASLAPLSVIFLLAFSVFLSAGQLLQATVEENENRVMEIILSSVTASQLVWGKILGLGATGLLQLVFYLALIYQAAIHLWVGFDATPAMLGAFFIYFMLGQLLYAGLLAVTGIVFGSQRESNQFALVWPFAAVSPIVLLWDTLTKAPNGTLALILSYFPLSSPATMVFRLAKTTVPVIDIVLSLALLIGAIYLVVNGAAKIFRTASLMHGKRARLSEIMRWLVDA